VSDKTYGFGLVGCGVIAPTHAEASAHRECQLLAVCDLNEAAATACAAEFGAEPYTDLAEMLARDDIDVVNILTPSGLHARLGVQCADAGKHVICTKPIDITLENIDALIEAGERNNVKIAATHQNRGYPIYEKIKRYIDEGRLGEMLYGNAFVPWFRSDEYYAKGWQGTKALDGGGALINQSIHYIDLLVWFMGGSSSIYGFADALVHDIETEDIGSAVLKFEGAHGIIQGSTCTYTACPRGSRSTGRRATWWWWATMSRCGMLRARALRGRLAGGKGGAAEPKGGMQENAIVSHVKQIGDVIAAIEEGREPKINGREAGARWRSSSSVYKRARRASR
jgi:UDP-N-acetyl-2-amino-2-deoxyglucuronate dehydrogenase